MSFDIDKCDKILFIKIIIICVKHKGRSESSDVETSAVNNTKLNAVECKRGGLGKFYCRNCGELVCENADSKGFDYYL